MPPTLPHSPSPSDPSPVSGDDPFDLLGLPARLELTPARVERAYLARIAAAHPDSARAEADGVDDASPEDDSDAAHEAGTARLNHARATLLSSESRALALLARILRKRPGLASLDQPSRTLPAGFLQEILQAREELDTALEARDEAGLQRWKQWGISARSQHEARAGELLERLASQPDAAAQPTLAELRAELNAWRYVERLLEQLT